MKINTDILNADVDKPIDVESILQGKTDSPSATLLNQLALRYCKLNNDPITISPQKEHEAIEEMNEIALAIGEMVCIRMWNIIGLHVGMIDANYRDVGIED